MASKPILALDLGTSTGWAVRHEHGNISSGVEKFMLGRFEGGGMRYLRFSEWLEKLRSIIQPQVYAVYFEEVRRHKGVDAAHVYGGFLSCLTSWCEIHDIPYQGIPVGTIKKHVTGHGNANKADMLSAMSEKLSLSIVDDNQADALALLDYVVTQKYPCT